MIRYRILGSSDPLWNEYLYRFPEKFHDINFTSQYHKVMENKGKGRAELFIAEENGNIYFHPYIIENIQEFISGTPKTEIYDIQSVFGYTGPILNTNDVKFINCAEDLFERYSGNRNVVVQFIRFNPILRNHFPDYSSVKLEIIPLKPYVFVDLTRPEEKIFRSYNVKLRESINSALKYDDWQLRCSYEKEFYDDVVELVEIHLRNIEVAKYYLGNDAYYDSLYELILTNGLVMGAYDKLNGELLCGDIFVFDKGTAYYLHTAYRSKDPRTSKIHKTVIHKAFMQLKKAGLANVCFGGGVTNSIDDSLLNYKKTFSMYTEHFYIGKRILDPETYSDLCRLWSEKYPDLAEKCKNIILKYRFTE